MTEAIETIFQDRILRGVISNPKGPAEFRKIQFRLLGDRYQLEKFTEKQAFHAHCGEGDMAAEAKILMELGYRQLDAWSESVQYTLKVSKKGKATLLRRGLAAGSAPKPPQSHNREKRYILKEAMDIPPLVDLGVFTHDGKVIRTMYDKFRQINRFLEMVGDAVGDDAAETLHIIDFGCGKSYLTFVLYYYFTEIQKRNVQIAGLDLKADVIKNCNAAAKKYGYENLHFEVGDINGYRTDAPVDMVVTLHACDTATDYALYNAIMWNARMILSVPCCQHELNGQIQSEDLGLMTRYGIIKERFAALATDAIRANLLECCGYKTQVLEFVDFAHTPKNLLIRAVKKGGSDAARAIVPAAVRKRYLGEVERMMEEFHLDPTLYRLLKEAGRLG